MKLYEELKERGLIKDVSSPEIEKKLNEEKITFYWGTDPTADSLHIGHYSSLVTAKRLARAGHNPILLVGGATGLIGDPRPTSERTIISKEDVDKNLQGLSKQVSFILEGKAEIVNNYDWSKDINFIDFLRDYGKFFNINYMLDKDIIKRRLDTGITYTEFSYMIMQALDFEYLFRTKGCIMQAAGSDQWGNITSGIELIRKKNDKEAYGFTMPLITDKYGNKIGKSEGNAMWLDKNKTSSYEMYQYLINFDDEIIINYLKVFTFLSLDEIKEIEKEHFLSPEKRLAQKILAREIISDIHSKEDFEKAAKISENLFSENIFKLTSEEIISSLTGVKNFTLDNDDLVINELLVKYNICQSKREAREMIEAGAISINNKKITNYDEIISKNIAIESKVLLIKKGKKNYYLGIYN